MIQAEKINETWKDAPATTILAGDFNCPPGSPPMQALGPRLDAHERHRPVRAHVLRE
jgi:endonuclease/exonuclease/phosphatase family metal-dependent hydrolase